MPLTWRPGRRELEEESMKQSDKDHPSPELRGTLSTVADVSSLRSGSRFQILDFSGDDVILERLRELGLRKGSEITYVRQAPFGGPYLFQLPTTLLALREEELRCLKFKIL